MNTPTETLVSAMRALANDIQSEDGVANAAIHEAAQRLEEQQDRIKRLEEALTSIGEYWNRHTNERAMEDACWHAVNTAADALEAKEAKL